MVFIEDRNSEHVKNEVCSRLSPRHLHDLRFSWKLDLEPNFFAGKTEHGNEVLKKSLSLCTFRLNHPEQAVPELDEHHTHVHKF